MGCKYKSAHLLWWVPIIAAALIAGWAPSICAAPASTAPSTSAGSARTDTLFNDIKLTNEGVNAYDTGGQPWMYDFETNSFVRDPDAPELTGRNREGRSAPEVTIEPVATRCVNEKIVKPWQKTIVVGDDEFVTGDVLAYQRIIVKGWVKGDVQSINGRVIISESGQVDGDVKAPDIVVKKGGVVGGRRITTNPFDLPTEGFSASGIIVVLGFLGFLLVAAFLIVSLFPRQLRNLGQALNDRKAQSIGLGILMVLLLPVISLLIAITIVGIIVLPLVPLTYIVAITMGATVVGDRLGRRVLSWVHFKTEIALLNALVGIIAFMAPWFLVAILLGSDDGTAQGFGIFLLVVSIIFTLFPILAGIGAGLMTRLGYREYQGRIFRRPAKEAEAPTPAPPPIPRVETIIPPPTSSPSIPLVSPGEIPPPRPPLPTNPDIKPPLPSGGA
jgi:hypothetical protein